MPTQFAPFSEASFKNEFWVNALTSHSSMLEWSTGDGVICIHRNPKSFSEGNRMVSVNFQLEENLNSELNVVCDKRGLSKDGLMHSLIVNYLNKDNTALIKKLRKTNFSSLNSILNSEDDAA